ncbi:methylase involved in ubiquinone/menaquinone biosynthesis [Oscillatoria acuminata PCC 6304]|uniref:Methylase involved in ubiquinone/menaquinone biosynthesis n=1 Tax=Oscillatoria acuminata PCC 6304 TaxID=56110 RepID=K9TEW7_9CYAN|nr:methylase involved in ubiquinone/menaquinone biosynthesis [Oscillatoria acuminata PCC 6304]
MDVYDCGFKKMNDEISELRSWLKTKIQIEAETYFGVTDQEWIERATTNWFDDSNNYDGRWSLIELRLEQVGKVLDMSGGCGTFVLFGLQSGYDVWGVEPEKWKREYFQQKILASNYSKSFLNKMIEGVGESLPFEDGCFDIVTTYQTLEHVQCVEQCLLEMLRVLRPGGVLYIRCPNYNSFFEPHYRLPFLPKMNKRLASIYLQLLQKPTLGLSTLQWTTESEIIEHICSSGYICNIQKNTSYFSDRRKSKIRGYLPEKVKLEGLVLLINLAYDGYLKIKQLTHLFKIERNVDLWIVKK